MKLFIEPMDVWLFRDGRPFDALSDHRAQSLFPPYPTVMQGIIRSHHLVVKGIDLTNQSVIEEAVGTAVHYPPGFRIRGPFLARRTTNGVVRYFPLPADAVKEGDTFRAIVPSDPPKGVLSSAPTLMLLWYNGESEKIEEQWWLREDALLSYLEQGELRADHRTFQEGLICQAENLFQRENRLGVGLDDITHTTREGMLYEVEFVRPCQEVGLEVEVEGLDGWPKMGLMRVGGEGRGARFEPSNSPPLPSPQTVLPQKFKIFFITPTYFKAGWTPIDWEHFFDGKVELVAAAIGRHEPLGGFDLAARIHKPVRRYVPSGSVYFFDCKSRTAIKDNLVNQAITDDGAEIGFGLILIGRW